MKDHIRNFYRKLLLLLLLNDFLSPFKRKSKSRTLKDALASLSRLEERSKGSNWSASHRFDPDPDCSPHVHVSFLKPSKNTPVDSKLAVAVNLCVHGGREFHSSVYSHLEKCQHHTTEIQCTLKNNGSSRVPWSPV